MNLREGDIPRGKKEKKENNSQLGYSKIADFNKMMQIRIIKKKVNPDLLC